MMFDEDWEDEEENRKNGPAPVQFHVVRLEAGAKSWNLGEAGGPVSFGDRRSPVSEKEVILLGKVLFGRQRFAFEVQELDRTPSALRRVLKRAKNIEEKRFGHSDWEYGFGCRTGEGKEGLEKRDLSYHDMINAQVLAAKHSIQIKFQDIDKVEVMGDEVTLTLSKAPQCYVKPEGEGAMIQMEVCKDITGGARSIKFKSVDAPLKDFERQPRSSFAKVRPMVTEHSARMAALFRGQAPPQPLPTPARKRKSQDEAGGKRQRVDPSKVSEDIVAPEGSWLKQAVDRFKLKGIKDTWVSESHWKAYFEERASLEDREDGDQEDAEEEEEEEEEDEDCERVVPASKIILKIRSSIEATLKSTSLKVDAVAFARGVFLLDHDVDRGTVESHARIYAPNASGTYVDLWYKNHQRAGMHCAERSSELLASRGGPFQKPVDFSFFSEELHEMSRKTKQQCERIFHLDYDEYRRKNPTKSSLASHATLSSLGFHLFGAEGVVSNRKVFGLLVRSAGLGQFGEINGWPVAVARRRFKCSKGEAETDTEIIPGDKYEDPNVGCCIM